MSLRVGYKKGTSKVPAIIVAPHGYKYDDTNTDYIADTISNLLDCTHIINYGWERSDKFDYFKDKANCNNIEHIKEDVIKDEFLNPIINSYNNYLNRGYLPSIFIIHGVHDSIRNSPNAKYLDLIIGSGSTKRRSCSLWDEHFFCRCLSNKMFNVWKGDENGKYSGSTYNNLNQLLNHNDYKNNFANVEKSSFQIEIVKSLRKDELTMFDASHRIADSILNFLTIKNNPAATYSIDYGVTFPEI